MEWRGDGTPVGFFNRSPHKKYAGKHIQMQMDVTHSAPGWGRRSWTGLQINVYHFHPLFLFTALPRPRPFGPMSERSLHTCGFVVKFWDCCKNCNVKRHRTKPKNEHCIWVGTTRATWSPFLVWMRPQSNPFLAMGRSRTITWTKEVGSRPQAVDFVKYEVSQNEGKVSVLRALRACYACAVTCRACMQVATSKVWMDRDGAITQAARGGGALSAHRSVGCAAWMQWKQSATAIYWY